jgi:hypothetical protein
MIDGVAKLAVPRQRLVVHDKPLLQPVLECANLGRNRTLLLDGARGPANRTALRGDGCLRVLNFLCDGVEAACVVLEAAL